MEMLYNPNKAIGLKLNSLKIVPAELIVVGEFFKEKSWNFLPISSVIISV